MGIRDLRDGEADCFGVTSVVEVVVAVVAVAAIAVAVVVADGLEVEGVFLIFQRRWILEAAPLKPATLTTCLSSPAATKT